MQKKSKSAVTKGISVRIARYFADSRNHELQKQTGITKQILEHWRDGRCSPSVRTLEKFITTTGCCWTWLLTGNGDQRTSQSAITSKLLQVEAAQANIMRELRQIREIVYDDINRAPEGKADHHGDEGERNE